MKYFYAGAENSEWRLFLENNNITDVSLNFALLAKKVKFARPWTIADHFDLDVNVLLDAGAYAFNREDNEHDEEFIMDLAAKYMAFVAANIDRLAYFTEFDANALGRDWLLGMREDFYDDLGDKFLPVWHTGLGRDDLESLSARYSNVAVLSAGLDTSTVPLLNAVHNRFGVKLHGLGMSSMEMIEKVRWDTVGSTSWLSPSKYADTIIWTGRELKRYPKDYKVQARTRHKTWIDNNGFDAQKIIDDDRHEVLRLSVWSWQKYMDHISSHSALSVFNPSRVVTLPDGTEEGTDVEISEGAVATLDPDAGNAQLVPRARPRASLRPVPVVGVSETTPDEEGSENRSEPVLEVSQRTLLQCSSCVIRDMCPEMQPGAECAFSFPAHVASKNQMKSLQDFALGLQTQRVQLMMMVEQVNGGYADPNLSSELDRLQRMIKAKQDAEKMGFTVHQTTTVQGNANVMSQLFGPEVGQASAALPAPVDTNTVFVQSDVVEATIVEEGE